MHGNTLDIGAGLADIAKGVVGEGLYLALVADAGLELVARIIVQIGGMAFAVGAADKTAKAVVALLAPCPLAQLRGNGGAVHLDAVTFVAVQATDFTAHSIQAD